MVVDSRLGLLAVVNRCMKQWMRCAFQRVGLSDLPFWHIIVTLAWYLHNNIIFNTSPLSLTSRTCLNLKYLHYGGYNNAPHDNDDDNNNNNNNNKFTKNVAQKFPQTYVVINQVSGCSLFVHENVTTNFDTELFIQILKKNGCICGSGGHFMPIMGIPPIPTK